jgi:hypothetical protein
MSTLGTPNNDEFLQSRHQQEVSFVPPIDGKGSGKTPWEVITTVSRNSLQHLNNKTFRFFWYFIKFSSTLSMYLNIKG